MTTILKTGDPPAIASSRREFLATAGRLAAAPLVAAAVPLLIPSRANAGGPSLGAVWTYYFRYRKCVCGYQYPAGDCAHSLSNALAVAGYAGVLGAGYTDANCKAMPRRPIRARDVRAWFAGVAIRRMKNVCPAPGTGIWAVYEESAAGQGHVCLFNTNPQIYTWAGTGFWPLWPIQEFYQF